MDVLLGLDLGTTGCKAALYTPAGNLLGSHYAEYALLTPRAEWVEQDARLWWGLACETIRNALASANVDGQSIRAMSISTQGISFVPVDTQGNPLRNAISWLDTRAQAQEKFIAAQIDNAVLFQLTGKRPAAFYVLPKLLWLREHEPEIYTRTHKFLMAHDYLLYHFCGAALTDFSMASGSLLLDLEKLEWSAQLLDTFQIDRAQLPNLHWAGTAAGTILPEVAAALGVNSEMRVVVGGQDQKCAALGAGIRPGRVTVSLGTASAITCLLDAPTLDAGRRIPTFPFLVPGYWELEGVVSTAGAALKWVKSTFFGDKSYTELDALASAAPSGANGVCFYPHLAGAGSPVWQSDVAGAFQGLTLATGTGDIVRSVLEGIAFQIRANLQIIETMQPIEELVLFGGGAASALWCQIISNIANKPVYVTGTVDVANWGACLLAGRGVDLFPPNLAALNPRAPRLIAAPDAAAHARYQEIYRAYQQGETRLLNREESICPGTI